MAVHHIISLLLSLLPPSWMVASIRELENIYLFTSAITSQPSTIAKTPSNIDMDMNMDIDIIRVKFNFSSKVSSRELLTHSDASTMLRSMPPGDSMDMGKGYNDMIGCATCSLSQRLMQKVLLPCFILVVSSCFNPCVCLVVGLWTCINSVDTFMYPHALPILYSLILSQVFALVAT